jgi:peptidoglycan hydrolase CwlO-like protein
MIQTINNTPENSGNGDSLKVAFDKVNDNFSYVSEIIENIPTGATITQTSQLENDGDGISPFATVSQIPTSFPISGVTNLQQSLDNINNAINQLQTEVSGQTSTINIIQSEVNTIAGQISTINGQILQIQSDINNIFNIINP